MLADTLPLSLIANEPTASTQQPAPDAAEEFRRQSHLLTGNLAVVTSNDEEDWFGLTTASVCALSTDPPTLVTCLTRRSRLARELGWTRRFCVNVLHPDRLSVADSFADPLAATADQFVDVGWRPGTTGTPVLAGAVAAFECEVDLIYSYPRDLVVVGSVRHVASHGLVNGRGPVGTAHRDLIAG